MANSSHDGLWGWLSSLAQHARDDVIIHLGLFPIVVLATMKLYEPLNARYNIIVGNTRRNEFKFSTTIYSPTGELHPETSKEYFDQQIDVVGEGKLSDMFDDAVWPGIRGAMKKAQKATTREEPSPLQHLHKFMKQKDIDNIIIPNLEGYFSKWFKNKTDGFMVPIDDRERPIYDHILPIPVMEPGAKKDQGRVLFIRLKDGKLPELPKREQVRFADYKSEELVPGFVDDQKDNYHADRYDTLTAVYNALRNEKTRWLRKLAVNVDTGRREVVEAPDAPSSQLLLPLE